MLRPRKSRKARNSCGSTDIHLHEDTQSPSSSSDESSDIETPTKPRDCTAPSGIRQSHAARTSHAVEERNIRQRQYWAIFGMKIWGTRAALSWLREEMKCGIFDKAAWWLMGWYLFRLFWGEEGAGAIVNIEFVDEHVVSSDVDFRPPILLE